MPRKEDEPVVTRPGSSCSDDPCCVSPCDPPWLPEETCLFYYDTRILRRPLDRDQAAPAALFERAQPFLEFRITYQHRICRKGKQHGPLIYTVTLLPGEKVNLYHSERYRRTTSEQDRYSVATTFMQFTSAVHQARVTNSFSALNDSLVSVKTGTSVSVGGGLAGFLGAPSGSTSMSASFTDHNQVSIGFASDQFDQSVRQASMLTHAERSVVVSQFEDKETADITVRTIQNDNACRAVTYFVRQIVELYTVTTVVHEILFRIVAQGFPADWHALDDLDDLPPAVVEAVKKAGEQLPKVGDSIERPRPVTIPTDGTVYDPELANCCSCEPEHAHREELETELLALEVERRRALIAAGKLDPFELLPAPESEPAPTP
jgi:thermitase